MKKYSALACFFVLCITFAALSASAADWPDWRGPLRDGTSIEKNLPEKWSLAGENLAWKLPYGGAPHATAPRGSVLPSNQPVPPSPPPPTPTDSAPHAPHRRPA